MKKGFTLIELLSVIVVLAIISVIAVPTLIGVVNKVKLQSLKDSAYGLIESGNLYYAQYQNSNNIRFDIDNNKVVSSDTTNLLKYKGNVKQGVVIVSNKAQITVCVTDGKNSAYKNYNDTEVTLVSKKTCSIPTNTYIVYLDGEATRNELSNQELTDRLTRLESLVGTLTDKVNNSVSLDDIYPVGSVYISIDNTNPNEKFKGTWEKIEGRFLLGSSSSYTLGSNGGNSSVSYTPSGSVGWTALTIPQLPYVSGDIYVRGIFNDGQTLTDTPGGIFRMTPNAGVVWKNSVNTQGKSEATDIIHMEFGGNQGHTHGFTGTASSITTMPPYTVVNIWKRTA